MRRRPACAALVPRGEAVRVDAATIAAMTCPVCRGTARRWQARGTVYRVAGDMRAWKQEADEDGHGFLTCPGCDGGWLLDPVRTEGGTGQWLLTAWRGTPVGTRVALVVGVLLLVTMFGAGVAAAADMPGAGACTVTDGAGVQSTTSNTSEAECTALGGTWAAPPSPSPTPTPAAAPAAVVVAGIEGPALTLLIVCVGLSLATSAAALLSGWHR